MRIWQSIQVKVAAFGIAALCFGYFAAYVPYSMMTKMATKGLFAGMDGHGFIGLHIQAVAAFATLIGMYSFLTLSGWWKYATHSRVFGFSIPRPQWFTFLSGICLSGVIITTTLSYTFEGMSIVFAMLLMRGGVLIMAPVVDLLSIKRKRKIYWPSWLAAGLSLAALLITVRGDTSLAMKVTAIVDISLYLLSYFLRFFIMSNFAKSSDADEKKRYFTEEQMVANPVLFFSLLIVGLVGSYMDPKSAPGAIWYGFSVLPFSGYFWHIFFIGLFSYGTGLFGSLIFLDRRENTFTVPANRVSSVISGVIATYLLAIYYGQKSPDHNELIGVSLILFAIIFLAYHSVVEKKRRARYEPKHLERQAKAAAA